MFNNGFNWCQQCRTRPSVKPLYVLDLSLTESLAAAAQAGCHGFDPRLPPPELG